MPICELSHVKTESSVRKQKYDVIFIEANDIHVCGGEGGGILRVMMVIVIINYDMDNRGPTVFYPGNNPVTVNGIR